MTGRSSATRFVIAALRPDAMPAALADELRRGVGWQSALAVANDHLLAPMLYATFHRLGLLHHIPQEVRRYLTLLHRLNSRRNRAVRRQLFELVGALNRRGIEPLLLKGAVALAVGGVIDPAARMLADIDLAVRPADRAAALDTLGCLGYRLRNRYPDGHHAYGEFTRDGDAAAVDLHFELIDQPYLLSAEEVWRRARRIAAAGPVAFHVPDRTDRLFHHLLHAQIHHRGAYYRGTLDLRQLHEFALMARAPGETVDWHFIWQRMRRYRLLTPLYSYVRASGRLFGTPWPFAASPTLFAELHVARCRLALLAPSFGRWGVPWGNLRGAFAWHRMERLYRDGRVPGPLRPVRHVARVLRNHPLSFPLHRLFRL